MLPQIFQTSLRINFLITTIKKIKKKLQDSVVGTWDWRGNNSNLLLMTNLQNAIKTSLRGD